MSVISGHPFWYSLPNKSAKTDVIAKKPISIWFKFTDEEFVESFKKGVKFSVDSVKNWMSEKEV